MSIQSSINSALGSVEQTLLRAGTVLKTPGTEPENKQLDERAKTKTTEETEQQEQQGELMPTQAAKNPAEQIITQGNLTAGAIASGRVQAKQQQMTAAKSTSADRLAQLRERKTAARKEVKKIKGEERWIRRQLEKGGGE